jgi:hypothetical protein
MAGRRRYRDRDSKPAQVANPTRIKSEYVGPRDWDSDAPDEHPAYTQAVSAVLEALEGLWYDSEWMHKDYADKVAWETAVNNEISILKKKIQELL